MIITINMLSELSKSILQYLAENNYSVKTLENYRCTYNQLLIYLMEHELKTFDMEIGKEFIRDHHEVGKPTTISKCQCRFLL